jgi:hypothetical protein
MNCDTTGEMTNVHEQPNFRDVRIVRTVRGSDPSISYDAEQDVNQALALGWVLLSVNAEGPVFVIGWTREGEAPMTDALRRRELRWRPTDR